MPDARPHARWPRPRRGGDRPPEAAVFARLRLRLTLWYSCVLAGALLLAGFGLYFGLRALLLQPIEANLEGQARALRWQWQSAGRAGCPLPEALPEGPPLAAPAPAPEFGPPIALYLACYDAAGALTTARNTWQRIGADPAVPPAAFSDAGLHAAALRDGAASDVIAGGPGIGALYRYALAVRDPGDDRPLGVIQVGRSIEEQQAALRTLRNLLLALSAAALLGATAGGFFLADRALAPARLAFARQQAFIADASHELRTPLTLLRADADVLLRGRDRLPPEDAALLEDIVAEADHMAGLAADLLTLARLDAGHRQIDGEVLDLADLADRLVRRLGALADARGVALRREPGAGPLALGDRQLLEQAALVLLDNAVKHTPAGGCVTVAAALAGGRPTLTVRDTGVGIPPEHLPRLGERFYRIDRARTREAGGAGLGLAIARGIAAAHGGTLALESAPGRGTTATLALPPARALDPHTRPAE